MNVLIGGLGVALQVRLGYKALKDSGLKYNRLSILVGCLAVAVLNLKL